MKKIVSLLMILIFTISLVGCKDKGTSADASKGSDNINSMVEDISKNSGLDNITSFKVNSKNQLVMAGVTQSNEKKLGIYDADGKLVKDIKIDFGEKLGLCTVDEKDNIYVLTEKSSKREITVFNASGDKTKTINLKNTSKNVEEDGMKEIALRGYMEVDDKGNFYILTFGKDNQSVEAIDKEGKNIKNLYTKCDFISNDDEGNLFVGTMEQGNGAKFYVERTNPLSGQRVWKNEYTSGSFMKTAVHKKGDKDFYGLNSDNISKYNVADGKFIEKVIDFKDYGLVDFNSRIRDIDINKNKDVYILITEFNKKDRSEKSQLVRCNLNNKNKNKNSEKVITLSLMYQIQDIDVAISKFRKMHPDIKIEVKNTITDFNDPSSYEKYTKNVNTEIMSGKGSDIICMNGLPYHKYVDKKALVNLSDFISKDKGFNMKNYNEKIINAFKYKKGLYTIPTRYEFSALAVDKKILEENKINIDDKNWTWNNFMDYARKLTKDKNGDGKIDQYALPKMKGSEIMQFLFLNGNYNKFIDEDKKQAKFDSKEFIDILNLAKEVTTKGIMDTKGDGISTTTGGNIQFLHSDNVFLPTPIFSNVILGDKFNLLNLPSQGSSFTSNSTFSINKHSKYKDECWEFIKFLISEDIQAGDSASGIPINNVALERVQKEIIEMTKDRKPYNLTQDDVNIFNKFISNLSNGDNENSQVQEIVGTETDKFISGQQTAEQAAKIIQNKVSTMINE
ncbi:ABC-type glycerol-3-phosphate transport system substrate-binding protein [Clostridium tetanomorphum]|uniref:Extracellular solute-binding protein n=1 Tax=Clostridium tetanomorphum TaxID=1553 RepID=A0A923J2C9_CLOTT|nr:extracellular solute-binding protein [Clostridium tetanomorphum]KAJ50556.1 extracellular solute-binding protein [Clostridium tetanomorphum DSM 665]MBC2400136.1 extracellular solute-binding protein [Clostridium tetanomorphum]MBP1866524.1 ABC-type glycerol-3-phosphate transport system substrate-binding protein [Clostridium tetanomorphum]NRS86521.1 ABC-type glycerol-3-phosphate transport system substrate-binding protein [Clostridium tetanomorphum]NRZ95450.1 ABC-type glycerol-3-phosphate transp